MKTQFKRTLSVLLALALLLGSTVFANADTTTAFSEESTEVSGLSEESETTEETGTTEEPETTEAPTTTEEPTTIEEPGPSRSEFSPEMEMVYEAAAIGFAHYSSVLGDVPFEYDPNISYGELLEDNSFQLQLADFILPYELGDLQYLIDLLEEAEYSTEDIEFFVERWAVTFARMNLMDIWQAVFSSGEGMAAAFAPVPWEEPLADVESMLATAFGYYESISADFTALVLDDLAQEVFEMNYMDAETLYFETQEWSDFQETADYFLGLGNYSYIWIVSSYLKNHADMNGIEVLFDEAGMVWEAASIGMFEALVDIFGASFRYDPSKAYSGFGSIRADEIGLDAAFFSLILESEIGDVAALETALMMGEAYTQQEATEFIEHVAEVFAYQSLQGIKEAFASEDPQTELVNALYIPELEGDIEDMVSVMLAHCFGIVDDILSSAEISDDIAIPVLLWVLAAYLQNFAEMNGIEIPPGLIEPYVFQIRNYELKESLTETGILIAFAEAEGIDVELVDIDPLTMQALLDAILPQDMVDLGVMLHGILLREGVTAEDLLIVSMLSQFLNEDLSTLDVVAIADILREATTRSLEELYAELGDLEELAKEELNEETDPENLGEPSSRVLKNVVRYIFEGWEAISLETEALFEEEDETLSYVLAWVTALYIQNLAALNAEEPSMEKGRGAVSKQERQDNQAASKQLVTEEKMDTVISSFGLDSLEIYSSLDVGSVLDSYYSGELGLAAFMETPAFQEAFVAPMNAIATAVLARIEDEGSDEFVVTKAVAGRAMAGGAGSRAGCDPLDAACDAVELVYVCLCPPPTTFLRVSSTSWGPGAAAASSSFSIFSNTSWTISSNQLWLTSSKASGSNNGSFTLSVTANDTTSVRIGLITISGGGDATFVLVTQAAEAVQPTTLTITYSKNGASGSAPASQSFPIPGNITLSGSGSLALTDFIFGGWRDSVGEVRAPGSYRWDNTVSITWDQTACWISEGPAFDYSRHETVNKLWYGYARIPLKTYEIASGLTDSTWRTAMENGRTSWNNSNANTWFPVPSSSSNNRVIAQPNPESWHGRMTPQNATWGVAFMPQFQIELNSRVIQADAGNNATRLSNVIKSTMAHELGHVMGLGDKNMNSNVTNSLMNVDRDRGVLTAPTSYDMDSVNILYK